MINYPSTLPPPPPPPPPALVIPTKTNICPLLIVSDTTGRATATSNHKLPFLNKNKKSKPGHLASSIWNETENQKQK
jgi:hypothetical protein